jgi:hypothetical protein
MGLLTGQLVFSIFLIMSSFISFLLVRIKFLLQAMEQINFSKGRNLGLTMALNHFPTASKPVLAVISST